MNRHELVLVAEAVDAGGLADDDGSGQHAAAGNGEQAGGQSPDEATELGLERVDLKVQLSAAQQQPRAGEAGHDTVEALEYAGEFGDDAGSAQAAGRHVQVGVELVQVPAHLRSDAGVLDHKIPPVVREQLHFPSRTVEFGYWKIGMMQRDQRHGLGVDRVGLSRAPARAPALSFVGMRTLR